MVMVPENLSNWPFTSEIIMWRALKVMLEWTGSIFQVSACAATAPMAISVENKLAIIAVLKSDLAFDFTVSLPRLLRIPLPCQ